MGGTSALQGAAVFAFVKSMPGGARATRPRVALGVRSGAAASQHTARQRQPKLLRAQAMIPGVCRQLPCTLHRLRAGAAAAGQNAWRAGAVRYPHSDHTAKKTDAITQLAPSLLPLHPAHYPRKETCMGTAAQDATSASAATRPMSIFAMPKERNLLRFTRRADQSSRTRDARVRGTGMEHWTGSEEKGVSSNRGSLPWT